VATAIAEAFVNAINHRNAEEISSLMTEDLQDRNDPAQRIGARADGSVEALHPQYGPERRPCLL